ncbi:MOSC N-terminal beta barrel domain-containing protein [Saccharomonospora sp. NPDC006951]
MARVAGLFSYPVKGCAPMVWADAMVTAAGLAHDRSFMVVGPDGVFRSQRRDPRLALVRPFVLDDGARMTLAAGGIGELTFDVDVSGRRSAVELFGTPMRGIDQGEAVAEWLSTVLGSASRLVRVPPEHARVTDGATPGTSGFADSSAIHLLAAASVRGLNRRLAERGLPGLPVNRFRPNIVVEGWEAHYEDGVRGFAAGSAEFGYTKPAIRCAVTTVDQHDGARRGPEPLRTLATYRRIEGGVAFGTKFAVLRKGKVSVGDELIVSDRAGHSR